MNMGGLPIGAGEDDDFATKKKRKRTLNRAGSISIFPGPRRKKKGNSPEGKKRNLITSKWGEAILRKGWISDNFTRIIPAKSAWERHMIRRSRRGTQVWREFSKQR